MINNKADTIEEYILKKLAQKADRQIELKRTTLADEIRCAPSQISYVLSTRFTTERGFVVESRRGLGGYIRITLLPEDLDQKQMMYRDMLNDITEETPFVAIKSMLDFLLKNNLITRREAELIAQTTANLYTLENEEKIEPVDRAKLIRSIFITLAKIT
ncbi:MAG: CtsR family transcriptional regulator [Selenomonadaceae bacterium]|nr:CtsR family transcriptional regulator [Selenomonadaceae bacterium]